MMTAPAPESVASYRPAPLRPSLPSFEAPVLGLTAGVALLFVLTIGALPPRTVFGVATLVLLGYLATELLLLGRRSDAGVPWLASPVSIASLYTFGVGYGITNVIFWTSGYASTVLASRLAEYEWQATLVVYAIIGACAMWIGFRSGPGMALGRALWRSHLLARWLRSTYDLRWGVFWLCVVVSLVSRLVQVRLGVYGVLAEGGGGAAYKQFLNYTGSLGVLALIGIAGHIFSQPSPPLSKKLLFLGILAHECGWGVVAADKTDVVIPVVIVGLVNYVLRRRLPVRYGALGLGLLVVGYLVLMPLRKLARDEGAVNTRSVVAIIDAALAASALEISDDPTPDETSESIPLAALNRLNHTATAAVALRYAAEHPEDPVPRTFAGDMILAPVYAVVPRALWPTKPRVQDIGTWFYQTVLSGRSQTTLAGPSVLGYLNFAGGVVAIIAGFLLIGVLQRGVHDRFVLGSGGGALILLLGLLGTLGDVPSLFSSLLTFPVRLVPLLLIAQYALFRR